MNGSSRETSRGQGRVSLHVIPLFGWLVSRGFPGPAGRWVVRIGAAAWAVFVLMLMIAVHQGQDLHEIFRQPF